MGNDLYVIVNGEEVANIGRKHNYCFYGDEELPTENEVDKTISDSKQHIISTLVGYATWLADQKDVPVTENIDDIVSSIKELIDVFEDEAQIAGRNFTLGQLTDEFNEEDIEVIDDGELEKRRKLEEGFAKAKKKMFADLHLKMAKVNWDAVEHQTGMVDLDFEKDTLVGEEWDEKNDEYLDGQNRQ